MWWTWVGPPLQRCEVLQSEHVTAAEMHNALEEEVEKLQDKVRSLTLEQRVNSAYKEKTRQLFEQVRTCPQPVAFISLFAFCSNHLTFATRHARHTINDMTRTAHTQHTHTHTTVGKCEGVDGGAAGTDGAASEGQRLAQGRSRYEPHTHHRTRTSVVTFVFCGGAQRC
jgi:hypothetical protein